MPPSWTIGKWLQPLSHFSLEYHQALQSKCTVSSTKINHMPIVALYWSIRHNQTIISVHFAHMKVQFTLQIAPKFKSDYNFLPRLLCTLEFTIKWADWDNIPGPCHPVPVTTKVPDYFVDVWRGTSTIVMHNPHQLCKLLAQT
jgi:hypothetical protein